MQTKPLYIRLKTIPDHTLKPSTAENEKFGKTRANRKRALALAPVYFIFTFTPSVFSYFLCFLFISPCTQKLNSHVELFNWPEFKPQASRSFLRLELNQQRTDPHFMGVFDQAPNRNKAQQPALQNKLLKIEMYIKYICTSQGGCPDADACL